MGPFGWEFHSRLALGSLGVLPRTRVLSSIYLLHYLVARLSWSFLRSYFIDGRHGVMRYVLVFGLLLVVWVVARLFFSRRRRYGLRRGGGSYSRISRSRGRLNSRNSKNDFPT